MKLPIGSHTFYNQLENCPHQAFHRYVGKTLPFIQTEEMKWGDEVHQALERRIKYGATLPDTMAAAEAIGKQFHDWLDKVPMHVEYHLAMTRDGQPCDYKDYDNVFFRGKLDCVLLPAPSAWMVDWKTGGVREDPTELERHALLLKVNHPDLENIQGEYFWMKTGQPGLRYTFATHDKTYARLVNLRAEAETYLKVGEWPKRKTPLCGWCDVLACEHNTKLKRLAKEGR